MTAFGQPVNPPELPRVTVADHTLPGKRKAEDAIVDAEVGEHKRTKREVAGTASGSEPVLTLSRYVFSCQYRIPIYSLLSACI